MKIPTVPISASSLHDELRIHLPRYVAV